MKDAGGGLVNITSGSALFGLVGQSNYAAANGGINALTRSLSLELARFGISVNALYPIALTDMTAPVLAMAGGDDGPLRTVFGAADDVARVVVGLAAPTSTMTGQIISFDGTEMVLWSHPDRVWKARSTAPWSDDDVAAALLHIAAEPAALNPDDVGAKTRAALRPKRG
jgi:3-oxoacyl-[acyl-carrier protein] reductase